ncbi:extracellular solute-binding protein family 1 [Clostridium cellulovorans 743B]|uniref:Extracellular solute-binding protein family 1 n=2 Tax=Clostridium cellulovorans TaxID=1493 RepID=D9SUD2_CLOC7|nr:extracellular solute-binding protein [Clostridium cellulovorans]ADL52887.1 extracellular solute-binding protein family 1 [Clostridium cellulovorans 743B]
MKKTKKIVSIALVAAMAMSVLVGCGSSDSKGSSKDEKVTLTFATHRTDKADTTLREMADRYEKDNPNITIEIEAIKDADQTLKTRAAAGELPDVCELPTSAKKSDYGLYFVDISDLGFTKDKIYCYDSGEGDDGVQYGLNSATSYTGIIYNKQAFKKAGITKTPQTMDEFFADCQKLKDAGVIPFGTNFKDQWPLSIYANDKIFAIEMTGNANYTNDSVKEDLFTANNGLTQSFDFLAKMKEKGYVEPDLMSTNWDQFKKDHASGKIAMTYLGSWYLPQMAENGANLEDIGMFPLPGAKGQFLGGDWCYGVAKNSKHQKEAKDFLKWMWEGDNYIKAVGGGSPLKGGQQTDPALKELLAANKTIIIPEATKTEIDNVYKNSEIDLNTALQAYLTGDKSTVVKEYNDKFAKAKKSAGM